VGHAPPQNAAALVATGLIVMVEFAHFNRDEEEYPMTDASLLIEELAAKSGDGDFLRAIAESVMQLIMEADVDGLIGAGRHERSGERATWRNGYRDRSLDTRVGTLNLKIPKLRTGTYFPGFLEPRKMVEKALVAVIQEAWIGGVSTRRVDELVQAMGMTGISKSSVSKLCKDIDERVLAFLKRPLVGEWPYIWLDATYLKVREGGRIVSVAAIIAVAVNTEGRREIVGLHIGPSEAETFWATFLKDLVRRGLTGVKLVISDAHEGLKAAITRVMGATWQRCRVHFMRNALAHVPKGQHTMVSAAIRQAFIQPDQAGATQTWRHVADQLRTRWPKLGTCMDDAETDVLAYTGFPTHGSVMQLGQPHDDSLQIAEIFPVNRARRLMAVSEPAALLVITRPGQSSPMIEHRLKEALGLTETEARVAVYLTSGTGDNAIALAMGIAVSTVRTHVRSILAKAHVHSKSELAHLLTMIVR
jgi:putative transposase